MFRASVRNRKPKALQRLPPHPEIPRRAVGGAGMQVAACGGDRGVPEGLLDEVDRRAVIQGVASVRVS